MLTDNVGLTIILFTIITINAFIATFKSLRYLESFMNKYLSKIK